VIYLAKIDPISQFRSEHAKVRDALLDLIEAINMRDAPKALEILSQLNVMVGPHFRWEEESLYPVMERFFGRQYLEYLLGVHDRIVKRARELLEILSGGEIKTEQVENLSSIVRNEIIPHPIECDGIALFAEKLSEEEVEKLRNDFERTHKEGVPLLEWAEKIKDEERRRRGLKEKALI
jgi:hemerythrin